MSDKIVISGYYGFSNAGDEAMLSSLIASLKRTSPQGEITVISGNPARTKRNHGVYAVHRFNPYAVIRAIKHCTMVISGGGSLLQNVTSSRSLYYYLAIMEIALYFHKPLMLYGQGIGPINGEAARRAVASTVSRATSITVRDEESKHTLTELGVNAEDIEVTADAVLSVPVPDTRAGERILASYGVQKGEKIIALAFRDWEGDKDWKRSLAEGADILADKYGCRVVFIPMQYAADVYTAESIAKIMHSSPVVLTDEYRTEEFMSLIACANLVIANRLHALIFAAVTGVPVTAVSYDPKIDGFMAHIGAKVCCTMESLTTEILTQAAGYMLEQGGFSEDVCRRIQELRTLSDKNNSLVSRILRTCRV